MFKSDEDYLLMDYVLTYFFFILLGDACIPNPCQNGGSCIFEESTGSFRCTCPPGYTGRTCDIGKLIKTIIVNIMHVNDYR